MHLPAVTFYILHIEVWNGVYQLPTMLQRLMALQYCGYVFHNPTRFRTDQAGRGATPDLAARNKELVMLWKIEADYGLDGDLFKLREIEGVL